MEFIYDFNKSQIEEVFENGDLKQITLDYMRKYGWENVRGYAWSVWNLKHPPKKLTQDRAQLYLTYQI